MIGWFIVRLGAPLHCPASGPELDSAARRGDHSLIYSTKKSSSGAEDQQQCLRPMQARARDKSRRLEHLPHRQDASTETVDEDL